jgi:hypothetical protein
LIDQKSAVVVAIIGELGDERIFSLSDARQTLDLVQKLTRTAVKELSPCQSRMNAMLDCDPRLVALEKEFEVIVRKWVMQVRRLGVKVYGLWELGFDTGEGYLCWRYPEIRLGYFLEYGEDFQCRRPLKLVIEETQPEWAFQ